MLLLAAAKTENDFILLGNDLREINADVRCADTPARCVSRVVSNLRAMDHRFGGSASDVDARAAEILLFDERHRPAQVSEAISQGIAALARADDDRVVFHGKRPPIGIAPKQYIGYSGEG